jgi:beta-lactamase superfamily II metal-dependent hydrolase
MMYQITESSCFMMSFLIVTKNNNAIVIDGGRKEDMPLLKQYIGGRHISAWILTHAHDDHIGGMVSEYKKNKWADFDIEKIYFNFPLELLNVPEFANDADVQEILPEFAEILPEFKHLTHIPKHGETIMIDEVRIDFIFTYRNTILTNIMNNSSLVFKLTTPNTSVVFLGDIGAEAGDVLYYEYRHLLKADMVQMSHHGAFACGMEVYSAIKPDVCLWCCREENYNGLKIGTRDYKDMPKISRMYPATVTREWMDILGAKIHYVTKDGTNEIVL